MKLTLVYILTTFGSVSWGQQAQAEYEPVFLENLDNQTVVQGRDVFFTCVVNHLGEYRVAWIKSDSKTILAVHTHMVAHNNRISVTHNGHNTWKLKVSNVQKNDSGSYMCQINTDPMRSQMGHLSVQVPPDVVDEDGSRDHVTVERGSLQLVCRATGIPPPKVTWKREDGKNIVIRTEGHKHQVVRQLEGEVLELTNVQRTDMGPYMCIASNGVPPSVSKRYQVQVHFQPDVKAASQLVAAPAGSNVTLECYVETSPKAMNIWTRETGEKLDSSSTKYLMEEKRINEYSLNMRLTISFLEKKDFGGYNCSSVNAIGQADFTVRLQELDIPKTTSLPATHDSGRRKRPPVERTQPPPTKRRKRPTTTEEVPVEQPPLGPVTLPPWLVDEENEVDNRSARQGSSSLAVCILSLGLLAWILC